MKISVQRNNAFLSLFQPGAEHRDAAIAYASCQLFVHPLAPRDKRPVFKQWQHKATTNFDQIKDWWPVGSERNIGIYLRPSCIVVVDVDPRNGGDKTFEDLVTKFGSLPPTYTVKTAGEGRHYYFRVPVDFYDSNVVYPNNIGDGVELLINKYVVAPPSQLSDERQYAVSTGTIEDDFTPLPFDWLDEVCRARALEFKDVWHDDRPDWSFSAGARNDGMTKVAGALRRIWFSPDEIEETLKMLGNKGRFEPFDEEADRAAHSVSQSIGRHRPGEIKLTDVTINIKQRVAKPILDNSTLIGPIGEFIQYIEPTTEAHPAALLGQALAVFGNMIGAKDQFDPGPGFTVEDAHHKTALYVMVVGESAQAAKGDSWARVHNLFKHVDNSWKYHSGIQTGEAIIDQLADPEETDEVLVDNTRGEIIPGIRKGAIDKRFLVYEPEFVRLLHVSQRQGSIVKDILRTMWDTGATESIAKSSRQTVTNGTLSIVGHITKDDLSHELHEVDLVNGFANRFLYVHADRTKFIEKAPPMSRKKLKPFIEDLKESMEFAQDAPEDYSFTEDAFHMFSEFGFKLYQNGKKPIQTLQDKMSSRARPLVYRTAVIYAISECSHRIEVRHMEAALAFWKYCTDSINYIFSNWISDPDADKLYRALVENAPGLTTSQIYSEVFKRNKSSAQITRVIGLLMEEGHIQRRRQRQKNKTVDVFFVAHQPYTPTP